MTAIDFLEDQARRNALFSLETLTLLQQRAHSVLALLLGGAGGAAVFALAQWGKPGGAWLVWAVGSLSLWWFGLAAWLALRAVSPREVRAPANSGYILLQQLRGPMADYAKTQSKPEDSASLALTLLREAELENLHETASKYRAASKAIAGELDLIYRCAAASPLCILVALLYPFAMAAV